MTRRLVKIRDVDEQGVSRPQWVDESELTGEATEVTVFSLTVELTNAEIIALPVTPIVIVPPTEILNYEGFPTRLQIPLFGFTLATNIAVEYSNVHAGVQWFINLGSDNSFTFSGPLKGSAIAGTGGVTWFSPAQITGTSEGATIAAFGSNLNNSLLDNAIVLAVNNQGNGIFEGGDAANSLIVTVLYTVIDV